MTNIVLKSARGVNYSRLQQLLAAGNWKEADKETRKVMLQVVSRESKRGWLKTEDIDNFPCEDLQTIDQLWLHYSQGKFGFSVQKAAILILMLEADFSTPTKNVITLIMTE